MPISCFKSLIDNSCTAYQKVVNSNYFLELPNFLCYAGHHSGGIWTLREANARPSLCSKPVYSQTRCGLER